MGGQVFALPKKRKHSASSCRRRWKLFRSEGKFPFMNFPTQAAMVCVCVCFCAWGKKLRSALPSGGSSLFHYEKNVTYIAIVYRYTKSWENGEKLLRWVENVAILRLTLGYNSELFLLFLAKHKQRRTPGKGRRVFVTNIQMCCWEKLFLLAGWSYDWVYWMNFLFLSSLT